ncbi:MAG: dihydrodipicolinate reductase [Bryobacteraceae bacterium]|nr:dihydrodipicolinate reductase [Bryobacteraceae bacterium]MDW8379065.1 dihydrodipicolinate reductase C-terminal domain-containing protein [Bryobacterales bacterium]
MRKLALVGYGKMGKLLDQLAPEYGFETVLRLDEVNNHAGAGITAENFQGVDVAIEFSTPSAVVDNLERLAKLRIPTVVGTTGWSQHLPHVQKIVADYESALVWSPNFSIGVNVFVRLVREAARWMASEPSYGAWAWEIHHATKKDAPSGTLEKLVAEMKSAGFNRRIDISSNRAGSHPGTHEIGFDSPADTITLRHSARNREGFARGALRAAQWLPGRKGCFEFADVLFEIPA